MIKIKIKKSKVADLIPGGLGAELPGDIARILIKKGRAQILEPQA